MKKNSAVFFILFLFLIALPFHVVYSKAHHKLIKAMDPVSWSIAPSSGFPATTQVGSSYVVTYTLTNNLPFTLPLSVSGAYNGGKFAMTNFCNTTLPPKGSCKVYLLFQPIKAGVSNAIVTMAYNRNRVPLPQLSSVGASQETVDRINGHVVNFLPPFVYIGVSYPVTFTFVNNGNSAVTTSAVNVSGFTASANTCTSSIAASSSCTVTGNFTPSQTGPVTLGVTYVYANGSVPLTTQSNASVATSSCHEISGDITYPLPINTLIYADNVAKYVFLNDCPTTMEKITALKVTSDQSSTTIKQGTAAQGLDTCTNAMLAPQGTCYVYVSVVPNAVAPSSNDLSVTAAVTYNNGNVADATSSETVAPLTNQGALHTVMFENQCDKQSVWYGFNPNGAGGDPTPSPSWQAYQLDQHISGAAPSVKIFQVAQYNGGSLYGRTGCEIDSSQPNYGICATANCTAPNNSNGQCSYAPNPPFTTFEENMLPTTANDGVYDISLINGFNVPGELRSLAPYNAVGPTSNFSNTCGNSAGALIQPGDSALGICTWSFSPPSSGSTDCTMDSQTDNTANYYNVSYGSSDDNCTPGSCSGSQVCGESQSLNTSAVPVGTPIYRHCGTFEGYWTVADWVGFTTSGQWGTTCNLYSHYSMGTNIDTLDPTRAPYGYSTQFPNDNPLPLATLGDMFACKPTSQLPCYTVPGTPHACFNRSSKNPADVNPYFSLNTGYNAGDNNACGCQDWNRSGTPASAQTAQSSQCLSFNPFWTQKVYPRILWLKEACPTAYSYQFDDTSSSFTCNIAGQRTSYQLTFCPGGKSGAPGT